jgi:ubiquinone biosynthesis protein
MISGIQSTIRNTRRFAEILSVLIRHGFGGFVGETGLDRILEKGRTLIGRGTDGDVERLSLNVRLRMVLEALGPTFIKLGQILSTRPDLIPADLADEFRALQADAPKVPFEEIRRRLEEEFDGGVDELFQSIEETPLAAASMAQVHRAVLNDGTAVVIKVLRPGIEKIIESDMEILQELARLAESHFENEAVSPLAVVEEFAKEIRKELNFTIEARSTDRLRVLFEDDPNVSFPAVYHEHSTRRVLTLEEVRGRMLGALKHDDLTPEERRAVVLNGSDAVFRMCMEYRFFHADPHPGNIFVLEEGRICFIDCGMTGHIDERTSHQLAELIYGVVSGNVDKVLQVAIELSGADQSLMYDRRLRGDVSEYIDSFQAPGGSLEELQLGAMLQGFFDLLRKWQIRCPSDLVFLIKAMMTIEGVGREWDPSFDLIGHVKPMLQRKLLERYRPGAIKERLVRSMASYIDIVEDLPGEVRSLLAQTRRKNFAINLHHQGLDRLSNTIDRASRTIAYGLIFAAVIMGASILILADAGTGLGGWLSRIGFGVLTLVTMIALGLTAINFWKARRDRR